MSPEQHRATEEHLSAFERLKEGALPAHISLAGLRCTFRATLDALVKLEQRTGELEQRVGELETQALGDVTFTPEEIEAHSAPWSYLHSDAELEAEAELRSDELLRTQALDALHAIASGANDTREQHQDLETIREALEKLGRPGPNSSLVRPLVRLVEGVPYRPGPDEFAITDQHSIEDVLYHLAHELGPHAKDLYDMLDGVLKGGAKAAPEEQPAKPPLGLRPRWIARADRRAEVREAMDRYAAVDKPIPLEWLEELLDLEQEGEAAEAAKPEPPKQGDGAQRARARLAEIERDMDRRTALNEAIPAGLIGEALALKREIEEAPSPAEGVKCSRRYGPLPADSLVGEIAIAIAPEGSFAPEDTYDTEARKALRVVGDAVGRLPGQFTSPQAISDWLIGQSLR